jgi:hypothetical protein
MNLVSVRNGNEAWEVELYVVVRTLEWGKKGGFWTGGVLEGVARRKKLEWREPRRRAISMMLFFINDDRIDNESTGFWGRNTKNGSGVEKKA